MKKLFAIVFLSVIVLSSRPAKAGLLYTDITLPVNSTGNYCDPYTQKHGESKAVSILGLVSTGNAGIHEAMRDGHIQKVQHIDKNIQTFFGVVSIQRTTVYGE